MASFTIDQSTSLLPLVRAIADEVIERRNDRQELTRLRDKLESSRTPEGLLQALAALDARIFEHDTALRHNTAELEGLGLTVLRFQPLTIHFPGHTRNGEVVFCWQEGEDSLCHGHEVGEEEEPRRPLKVKVIDSPKAG